MSILFEETAIGGMTLPNRFVRSATWEAMADPEGRPTDGLADLIEDLAKGEVGLIVVGHAFVLPNGIGTPRQSGICMDERIGDLQRITARIKRYASRTAIQINHAGGHTRPEWITGDIVAPSAYTNLYGENARELTAGEIDEIIEAFIRAGRRAKEAGFDALQIHAAHGYLINQFLSPVWNKRTDAYGGSLLRRSRFLFEICEGLKSVLGDAYPILVKLGSSDFIEGGIVPDEAVWLAGELARIGIAAVEVSGGSRYSGADSHIRTGTRRADQEAWFAQNARRIKESTSASVILVGGIRSFEVAESLVKNGCCDMVAMSRPFICEPDLVRRWRLGDRRKSRCVSDNLCFGPAFAGSGLWCETRRRRGR
jgi:2,4-dienoyl-CoA reductase-like NADH-dependent reductase (Old Yellow Enzyme family)